MKTKKWVILLSVLILAAVSTTAVLGYTTRVYKIKAGEAKEMHLGRAGASYTSSYYSGKVKLTRVSKGNVPHNSSITITQNPIDVRLRTPDGKNINFTQSPVYVYFKLRGPEIKKWEAKKLSIYYLDQYNGAWKKCTTYAIVGRSTGDVRASCRMNQYGLYSLGVK